MRGDLACMLSFLLSFILILIAFIVFFIATMNQARMARKLKMYPSDYRSILVGGKSYLYIESMLSHGMPQAIQEQINFFRYFRKGNYVGKFSEREKRVYLGLWYGAYSVASVFFISVIFGIFCINTFL